MLSNPPLAALASILIADDDVPFGSMLRAYLHSAGYTCELVHEGAHATQALARTEFHLLIADIDMPGNRRLELVAHLAGLANPPPIILLTGRPSVDTAMQAVELPVSAYLTKPPDLAGLLATVRQTIEDAQLRRSVVASHQRLQQWTEQIGRLQEGLQRASHASAGACFEAYVSVTLANLAGSLADFAKVVEVMVASPQRKPHVETTTLLHAMEEAVGVLERTRRNFHSKELCALRKKLEQLLQASANPAPAGAGRTANFTVKTAESLPI